MPPQFPQTLILVLGVLSTLLSALGCPGANKESTAQAQTATPAHQFILKQIRIEERRSGQILWRGLGSQAQGNFDRSVIDNLQLTRLPQNSGELPLTIDSPSAQLALTEGIADFSDAIITDTTGRILKAGNAHYSEKENLIQTNGPIHFVATGLAVTGSTTILQLGTGEVTINGPIKGVFTPQTP